MSRIRLPFRFVRAASACIALIALLAPRGAAQFEELWTRRFGDPGTKFFHVLDSGLASDGSLRVLAMVERDDPKDPTSLYGVESLLLLCVDGSGDVEWARNFHVNPEWSDLAGGLRVSADGCAYVASRSNGVRSLAKYSPHGDVIWRRKLDLNFFLYQKIVMALDVDGRVTVAGTPEVKLYEESDLAVVQFDAEGQERWRATYVGPGQGADLPWHMAFDGLGQVHLTGTTAYSPSPVQPGNAIVSVAFDRDGRTLWSTTFGPAPTDWAWPYVAHVAPDGTNTIAGASQWPMQGLYPQSASFLLRIDGAGKILWAHVDPMSHGMSEQPAGIAIAPSGDVFVSGSRLDHSTTPPGLFSSPLVEAYSSAGERLWSETLPDACENSQFASTPLIDARGRLVLLRSLGLGCYSDDMELVLLSPKGTLLASHRIDISGSSFPLWLSVLQDGFGDLRIVGSAGQSFPSDGWLLFASRIALE